METPTVAGGRSRGARGTPGSGRRRSAVKTPKSVLTPNDDAAEKASVRRKRRSQALRLSLSDAFAGHADQQASQHGQHTQQVGPAGQASGSDSKPMLSEEARNNLLEQCLKLATENKITDRNAWHLDLITHLPDIVGSGPAARAQHSSSSSFNFQKMSGGLDAGVTIYARRVELTYKSARSLGCYAPGKQQGDDAEGEDGYEAEVGEDEDGLDDAAAAAAKAQSKQKGRAGRQQGSADEEATLTTPDHLRAKKGDATFAVDPLFHTMSALFDEGGAKGLLLLNRSVYSGAHIMTDAQDVPEQQFPLTQTQTQGQQQQQDVQLDLRPLQMQLAACSSSSTAASVLTPGLQQLYTLLEETRRALPGYKQQPSASGGGGVDVAGIMQQALRNLPPNPLPKRVHSAQPGAAAAAAAAASSADADAAMTDADADSPPDSFADASPGAATAAADTDMQQDGDSSCSSGAGEGPVSGSLPVVASFLASCEAADEEADAAAAAAAADEGYGGEFDEGHPGYGDEGDSSWGGHQQQQDQQQQADRRQSLLGLGGGLQDPDQEGACGLDPEALQQLLGAAAGQQPGSKGGTTAGSGWAGSRFWKYRSAAAATARMAAGGSSSSGGAVKRAAASGSKGRSSSSASSRIDFTCRPADLSAALAPGDPRKTRLVSAPSASSADTLLPEDLRYQASSLLQLFLRPSPISFGRQQQQQQQQGQLPAWAEEGGEDDGEGWGGEEYGYGDDGDDFGAGTGAEGYNAGDLSVGDPGFSGLDGAGGVSGSGGSEWWSAEGELLSAPKRMAGGGVKYQRSAKQVDVRALKDLLWDSLVTVSSEQQAGGSSPGSSSAAASAPKAADSSSAAGVIPFQDVIVAVPSDSAAGPIEDVSVHMCFICLLHLANEKGLVVRAQEDLKTLTISNVQQ